MLHFVQVILTPAPSRWENAHSSSAVVIANQPVSDRSSVKALIRVEVRV